MKLIFPNGEHEPVVLGDGISVIGNGADCQVMLAAPGIALRHCEIHKRGAVAEVHTVNPQAVIVLNGKQITTVTSIKPGDLLLFAKVGCRVVANDRRVQAPAPRTAAGGGEEDGRTRVRMALPKFLLRGVSGPTFGKTYAVTGTMSVGRQADCDVSIPSDEISRHHVKLQAAPDGVIVEDLGSANGTFINGKRVHGSGMLKAGEELRLDTVRFLLMSPGMEVQPAGGAAARAEPEPEKPKSKALLWIVLSVVVLAGAALAALYFMGKI